MNNIPSSSSEIKRIQYYCDKCVFRFYIQPHQTYNIICGRCKRGICDNCHSKTDCDMKTNLCEKCFKHQKK